MEYTSLDTTAAIQSIQNCMTDMNPFGNNWWAWSKWVLVITVILKIILLIFRLFSKKKVKMYTIIGIIFSIFFTFYQTLSASCLYNGGCNILAVVSLLFPVLILLVLVFSVYSELKSDEDDEDDSNDTAVFADEGAYGETDVDEDGGDLDVWD
jgi:uncharacterized membrane protein